MVDLEHMALRWLAYEKGCVAVLHERTCRYRAGEPDVLGVTKARYLIEIEIKRSVSDFRADFKKIHRVNRDLWIESQPRQFYYFVPDSIFEKCKPLVPQWAGLARCENDVSFRVEIEAPVNSKAKRLNPKECVRLVRCMANQIVSFSTQVNGWRSRFVEGHWDNPPFESRWPNEPIWKYDI